MLEISTSTPLLRTSSFNEETRPTRSWFEATGRTTEVTMFLDRTINTFISVFEPGQMIPGPEDPYVIPVGPACNAYLLTGATDALRTRSIVKNDDTRYADDGKKKTINYLIRPDFAISVAAGEGFSLEQVHVEC
ncbi:hypothetical protein BT96DRAFT_945455 [Gymnopus androsaceus JB14]|uniref:Uncharacterized protein n=1 Tax=Gymnopus androsaceus JB14 TaxID=1447944 RepID=A0A6A4H0U7_9AGAR|nr:hypothetical protein BT96DRAFT_945455 [Gymnopus androsaceus JB14]